MGIMKHIARSTPLPRHRRGADPTKPRSISARCRNRNPCAACKRSRQKCSGGPPHTCSQCTVKQISCEPGKPQSQLGAQALSIHTEAQFIFEDGRSFTRMRQRSNTLQTTASSLISPINEANLDEDDRFVSPTSPAGPPSSAFVSNACESPTTGRLVESFGSFSFDCFGAMTNEEVFGSAQEEGSQELHQQSPVAQGPTAERYVQENAPSETEEGSHLSSSASEIVTSERLSPSLPSSSAGSSMIAVAYSIERLYGSDDRESTYLNNAPSKDTGLEGTSDQLPSSTSPNGGHVDIHDSFITGDFITRIDTAVFGGGLDFDLGLGTSNWMEDAQLLQSLDDILESFR